MSEQARVLVIEDEHSIGNMIKIQLETSDFLVSIVRTGEAGIAKVQDETFSVILLDLGLPDIDGVEVLSAIREISEVPVIIMTVRSEESVKVLALDAGADDYLVKPFGLEELKARLRAALRRTDGSIFHEVYNNGPLKIDLQNREVFVEDKEIKLTIKEFEFLKILALQNGRLVGRIQILKKIWGDNSEDKGHYLRIYVSHLRKKLGLKNLITTEPGVGYRINYLG